MFTGRHADTRLTSAQALQAQALAAMSDAANVPDAAHADGADTMASTSSGVDGAATEAPASAPEPSMQQTCA